MNKHIVRIKELIGDQVDMGTFGLVELELVEMEKELKQLKNHGDIGVVILTLKKAHDMLEVDFDKETIESQSKMSEVVELCEAIKEEYWMYKRNN